MIAIHAEGGGNDDADDGDDDAHGNQDARRENVLQSLDMTTPELLFWRNPDQLLLQDTMETDPPEAPMCKMMMIDDSGDAKAIL